MADKHAPYQVAALRRCNDKVGDAKRRLIEAIDSAEHADVARYTASLWRIAGDLERLQARIAKATGATP